MPGAASLLDSLTPGSRQFLLERSTVRRLCDDEHLFHHGDVADCMYLVESGRLAVQTTTSDGDTAIVRVIGPGHVVGELALIVDGLRRTGSVVALGASVVRVVHRSLFSELRSRDPGADRALVADLAARLAALSEQFVVSQFGTLADRVDRAPARARRGVPPRMDRGQPGGARRRWSVDRARRSTGCSPTPPPPASSPSAAAPSASSTPKPWPSARGSDDTVLR